MVLLSVDPLDLLTARDDAVEYLRALLTPPAWHAAALCRGLGTKSYFPARGSNLTPVRALCRACPVREECAAAGRFEYGVWGGLSERDRHRDDGPDMTVAELIARADRRPDQRPSEWQTDPCRGCAGNLSRSDLERGDGWCWACRPAA
jgi:hypothetical protein